MCNILDRVTQTVGVVIGGVDAPARHDSEANDTLQQHIKLKNKTKKNMAQIAIPCISRSMVGCVFDSIRYGVQLPVLHDHLHPQCGLSLRKQTILHPLEQDERLLDGPISPG